MLTPKWPEEVALFHSFAYVNHVFSRQQDSVVVNDDSSRRPRHHTIGPNSKNPPKSWKLADHTHACNDLTSFEYEEWASHERKRKLFEFSKTCVENSWNHFGWTYFRRVLARSVRRHKLRGMRSSHVHAAHKGRRGSETNNRM